MSVLELGNDLVARVYSCRYIGKDFVCFAEQTRYLGVYIKAGHVLKYNLDYSKAKFYGCINEIIRKIGNNAILTLSLCNSYCIPTL